MIRNFSFIAVVVVLIFSGVNVASAQEMPAALNTFSASTGSMNFDLSGTGNTWNVAVRGTRALTPHVALEFGGLFARPDLQGGTGTIILPEVQLQYHWRVNKVAPYAGGGVGFLISAAISSAAPSAPIISRWGPWAAPGSTSTIA